MDKKEYLKIEVLNVICGLLQVIGLFLVIFRINPVIIGICGFAAIVKAFLPLPIPVGLKVFNYFVAVAGFGIIIYWAFLI